MIKFLNITSNPNETIQNVRDQLLFFLGCLVVISYGIIQKKMLHSLKFSKQKADELVKERTKELEEKNKELERFNNLFIDREFRIRELKDKIKELEKKNE